MSYSSRQEEVLFPLEGAGAKDLKDAATTLHGTFGIPEHYFDNQESGKVRIKKLGFIQAATGGAQTIAGTIGVYVDGTITSASKVLASEASHVAGAKNDLDLNTTSSTAAVGSSFDTAPAYPEVTVDQLVQIKVVTAGTGAGDQTVWPYIVIQRMD